MPTVKANISQEEKEKILEYLKGQLLLAEEEFKAFSTIPESSSPELKIEKHYTDRFYFRLKNIVKICENM
jgi:coenzyme F420-reducing hydrogenase alpha subunit